MATQQAQGTGKPTASRVVTLKRRSEFLRIRKGARWATPAFVLEAKPRVAGDSTAAGNFARFGFTVTKQVGKAVERNRIRRRLRAAVRNVQEHHARRDFDYVLIARRAALDAAYPALVADLQKALERVHRSPGRTPGPRSV